MGIYQRNNGMWYIKITRQGKTVRKSLETTSKKEASLKHELLKEQLFKQLLSLTPTVTLFKQGELVDSTFEFHRPAFNQAFNEYLDKYILDHLAEVTLKEKQSLFGLFKKHRIDWIDIAPRDMMSFQKELLKDKSRSYTAKFITHLKAFLKWCLKKEYISNQTFNTLDFMKAPKQKRKKMIISEEHIQQILKYCENTGNLDMYFYILTLFITASRPNEIIKISYKDLDFGNETIRIWMSKVLNEKIVKVDKKLLKGLMDIFKANGLTNGCIFYGSIKHKDFYGKKFKKIREELKLPLNYTLYLFRHTAATNILEKTGDIYLVKQLLAHKNIGTTSTHYIVADIVN